MTPVLAEPPSPSEPSPTTSRTTAAPAAQVHQDGPADLPLTTFVGRAAEISALVRLMPQVRLLSLVGPGGSGKSRLAHTVDARLSGDGPYRSWWVPLAQVDGPAMLASAVAEALHVTEIPAQPLLPMLVAHLRESPGLLILDNCEHLVDSAAQLVGSLLRVCPELRVLTTSREPLAVAGETTWWVEGLSLPEDRPAPDVGSLTSSEAVQLFVDRARQVNPRFAVTSHNAEAIARLCRRLDGMPLALELAAARLRVLPLARIVERLDDAVPLLMTTNRDVPPRQATMRATLDWSHGLLPIREQQLFTCLSVFRGGFTLAAAEAVTAVGADTLDLLTRLVDRSLVQVRTDRDEERYRLLEVVRQYAGEQLGSRRHQVMARHARHMLDLAEQADGGLIGADQHSWLNRLHTEQDNMRSSLTWARQHDTQLGIRLAAALGRYWRLRGQYTEGREWLQAAVSAEGAVSADDPRSPALAKALAALGLLEFLQCEYSSATARLRWALRLYTAADDLRGVAAVRQSLGSIAREQGRYAEARRHHETCLALWRRLDEPAGIARAVKALGFTAWLEGEYDTAVELSGDALRRFRVLNDSEGAVGAMIDLGAASGRRGDLDRARLLLRESLVVAGAHGFREATAWATEQLGLLAAGAGERDEAAALLRSSLTVHHELGDRWRTSSVLDALAGVHADPLTGARLLAAAEQLRRVVGTPLPPADAGDHEQRSRAVRASAGDDEWNRATAEGAGLSVAEAVAMALTTSTTPMAHDGTAGPGPDDTGPVLRVHALGRASVHVGTRLLDPQHYGYAKPRELLYYLLSRPASTKAEIGLALWPEASDAELRNSFHTCLKFLRRALGGSKLVPFVRGAYRIDNPAGLRYDVHEFQTAFGAARTSGETPAAIASLAHAADLYSGDFLADVTVGSWAESVRHELRRRYEQTLLSLGTLLGRERRLGEAAEIFTRLVAHDPLVEAGHRGVMRCHAALGDRGRALRTYEELAAMLRDQMGAEPAPETTALYRRLRQGAATAVAAA